MKNILLVVQRKVHGLKLHPGLGHGEQKQKKKILLATLLPILVDRIAVNLCRWPPWGQTRLTLFIRRYPL